MMDDTTKETVENGETVIAEDTEKNTEEADVSQETVGRSEKKKSRKLESEIEGLKKQLDAANIAALAAEDKYLRMIAEYDNYRKRSAKEKESIYNDAYINAITNILPILDNIERATQYTDADAVAQGVAMILKSFGETFDKMGVSVIEAEGKQFDPNLHCAVMHIDDENYGDNEIVEVLQKGYLKGDKVIRYAMVKVAN